MGPLISRSGSASSRSGWMKARASSVGPLCTPLDVLARQVALPVAQIGDLLVIFQSGAYGPSASPTAFLNHPAPLEVLV